MRKTVQKNDKRKREKRICSAAAAACCCAGRRKEKKTNAREGESPPLSLSLAIIEDEVNEQSSRSTHALSPLSRTSKLPRSLAPPGLFFAPFRACQMPPPTAPIPNAPPTSSRIRSGHGSLLWSTEGPRCCCGGGGGADIGE